MLLSECTTVIVTSHDRPHFLRQALRSVCDQQTRNRIIVVDDSSAEHAPLVKGITSQHPRALYVRTQGNRGVSTARNIGAMCADSEYIAFLDDDDRWLSDYLESALGIIGRMNVDVLLCGFAVKEGNLALPEKIPPPVLRSEDFLLGNPGLRGSNLFIRRSAYFSCGGFDPNFRSMNDVDFGYRLFANEGLAYVAVPEPKVLFRQHKGARLSTPGSLEKRSGISAFWKRYMRKMSTLQRAKFVAKAASMWGCNIEFGLPQGWRD